MTDADHANVRQIAEFGWNTVPSEGCWRGALATRDLINRAKDVLVERYGITADAAFGLLQRLSTDSNVAIAEVSRALVDRGEPRPEGIGPRGDRALGRQIAREATRC